MNKEKEALKEKESRGELSEALVFTLDYLPKATEQFTAATPVDIPDEEE